MNCATPGNNTSDNATPADVEVTHISAHGVWVLVNGEELFLSFEHFPWFRQAPIGDILTVEMPGADHLYWPQLDVDLSLDIIRNPDRYPLVSRKTN